jgi:hypothetical protein
MSYTIPFSQLNKTNIPTAGGKGANLGEMTTAGFLVPAGFVLTTEAYDAFVQKHGLQQQIVDLANTVSADDSQSSETASAKIKQLFFGAEITSVGATPSISNGKFRQVRTLFHLLTCIWSEQNFTGVLLGLYLPHPWIFILVATSWQSPAWVDY